VIHSIGSVLSLKIGGGSPQGFEGTTMAQADDLRASIKVCMFDQYGTVVDMQTGLTEAAAPFLAAKGWEGDPNSFVTPKERSSLRTQAQRSKATHRAVPLQWHAMPSRDLRKAWRGN